MRLNTHILSYIFMLFFVFLFISCKKGNTNSLTSGNDSIESVSPTIQRLKLKADTARIYCQQKRMNTDFCILVDMKEHSGKNRFFVWDLKADTIIDQSLCAHGYGKGGTKTKPVFSNVEGSYCTSLGKYKTGARSYSQYGINIHYKLHGLEPTNNNAFRRIVVLHSFDYVPEFEIAPLHLPLGYSQGCPVINNILMKRLDGMFRRQSESTLLWIYY